jgi:cytochrome c oxidase assembly protein subunit 15
MNPYQAPSEPFETADFSPDWTYRPGPHWFALFATFFTWPLLFVGGLVTTYKVGMAVPDWPTTFGMNMFLYDFFKAPWGVFGEHTHRLYGAVVGLFTILLMVDFLAYDRRKWMKGLGVVALLAVIGQGVLGGFRVRWNSTFLAAFHGCFGQAFFGFMVALCVMTSRGWFRKSRVISDARKYRSLSVVGLGLIYSQVILGAWLRHYSDPAALGAHAVMAFLVFGHLTGLVVRVQRHKAEVPELVPASRALGLTLLLQIGLGIGAWWLLRPYDGTIRPVTLLAALVRTGHQANAGLLLASAVVLTLRSFGQLVGSPDPGHSKPEGARDLEAVA